MPFLPPYHAKYNQACRVALQRRGQAVAYSSSISCLCLLLFSVAVWFTTYLRTISLYYETSSSRRASPYVLFIQM